jgi:hypothetical protein
VLASLISKDYTSGWFLRNLSLIDWERFKSYLSPLSSTLWHRQYIRQAASPENMTN